MQEILYAVLWFAVSLLLLFRFRRENKVFVPLGLFFLLLGAWWLAAAVFDAPLFEGVWLWVLRGVTFVALVLACWVYYKETKRSREEAKAGKEKQERPAVPPLPEGDEEAAGQGDERVSRDEEDGGAPRGRS